MFNKDSAVQALRETLVTEPPTFAPNWPSGSIVQDAEQRGEVVLSSPDPVQRAEQAFQALSGDLLTTCSSHDRC